MRLCALFAAIALSPILLFSDDAKTRAGDCPDHPNADVMSLPVRVMTKNLEPVENVQRSDFVLKIGQVIVDICNVTHESQPASVGILLDISASMGGQNSDRSAIARAAIGKLLDLSAAGDEFFLEYVNDKPVIGCSFGSDPRRLRAGLQLPHTSGPTALNDGIFLALREMTRARHALRAILIVSDADDNWSTRSFQEIEKAYAASPVAIFLLAPFERLESHRGDNLANLISQSGGYAVSAHGIPEGVARAIQLVSAIHSPYTLYFAGATKPDGKLRVELNGIHPKPQLFYGPAFEAPHAAATLPK